MNSIFDKNKSKYIILLLIGLLFYSITSIFSKLASNERFLSFKYVLLFIGIIVFLGIYAIIWQQVLKNIDLSIAMSFKPLVLVLNTVWATLLFKEVFTLRMFIGFLLIIIGLYVMVLRNE